MATSSFFYGGSSAPEQNTVDQLIDALNAAIAAADEDRVDAETAAQQAADSASNAVLSEQNAAGLAQQSQTLLTQTEAAASVANTSANSAASSAASASSSASAAQSSATSSAASAAAAAVSEADAEAAANNPYVIAVGSDLAGSGWTYDFGLVTDAADPMGSGTTPGYIETVAENIDDVTTVAANIADVTAAVASAASAATSATNAASSATSASTSATNAAASASSAATSASTAATQATSASTSATAAAGSASAASTSATNAASSASSASASASAAATSATSASSSATSASGSASMASTAATAAQAAQIAAEAAYDNFDDRYLGSKTSAPTTDNDGNALVTGALYFNSALGGMYVWSGTAWGVIGSNPDAVVGSASSTDNAIARFDGTTGKLVQNSLVTIDDTGKANFNNVAYVYGMGLGISGLSVNDKIVVGGTDSGDFSTYLASDSSLGWSSSTNVSGAISDLRLYRDAANTLAQRRGTSPQTFRVYNTYTDGSNYERGFLKWASGRLEIGTDFAGTGSAKPLRVSAPSSYAVVAAGSGGVYLETNLTNRAQFADGGLQFRSDYQAKWSSDAAVDGTMDTGLSRDSAGVVKVTNGSTGLGVLKASSLDIATFDLGVLP